MKRQCDSFSTGGDRCVLFRGHRGRHEAMYTAHGRAGEVSGKRAWSDAEAQITGTEALKRAGFTHRRPAGTEPGSSLAHEIIDAAGNVVAHLKAREVWDWLRNLPSISTAGGRT